MVDKLSLAASFATVAVVYLLISRRKRRSKRHPVPLAFSSCEAATLDGYKLYISLPLGYKTADATKHYPVLVVLDAEPYLFPLLTVCARTNHFFARTYYYPDAILVGLVADLEADETTCFERGSLNVKSFWDEMRPTRARDYMPTAAESPWGTWPGAVSLLSVSGHADEFASWLATSLVPYIDGRFRTLGSAARALCGKSFGGSGVACCMIHHSCAPLFSEYLLCSPSLTWDDSAFFRIEAERRQAHEGEASSNEASRNEASRDDDLDADLDAELDDVLGPPAAAGGGKTELAVDDVGAGASSHPPSQPNKAAAPPHAAAVYCCVGSEEATEAAHRLKEALDSRTGEPKGEVTVEVRQGETHGSVSYPFVHRAMEVLKERWQRLEAPVWQRL